MDPENTQIVARTRKMIALTRGEIAQLREDIEAARVTLSRSQELLWEREHKRE